MNRTRKLGSSALMGDPFSVRIIEPTPEQVGEALARTEATATRIRDLVRKLDLPATAFDSVLRIYTHEEMALIERAAIERDIAESKERIELIDKLRANGIASKNAVEVGDYEPLVRPIPVGGMMPRRDPGYTPAMYDGLDVADIDELRELAKTIKS